MTAFIFVIKDITVKMDKKRFFDEVRVSLFKGSLKGTQVTGLELLIAEADRRGANNEYLAYVLATATWETAWTLQPISEYGKGKGRKYGVPVGPHGHIYYGRGYVQLTWDFNYKQMGEWLKVPLYANPELANDPSIAVQIIFEGMERGMFTGKKLSDYLDGVDESDEEDFREFKNARRIVNGTDRDDEIAKLAIKYERALRLAKRSDGPRKIAIGGVPVTIVDTLAPKLPKPRSGLLGLILDLIKVIFK